ncbi:MAG: uroporphyrinogen decarboxylase family protein, partial [Lentisphaeria bacterium]|nr:uroporphyrinogen decarboxylase family protein [Lentisphaeria bacterium]
MTKQERLLKAFSFEQPDRVPVVDWVQHGPLAATTSGRTSRHDFWTLEESGRIAEKYLDMSQGLNASFPQTREEVEDAEYSEDDGEKWYVLELPGGAKYRRNYWMGTIVERPFADQSSAAAFVRQEIANLEKQLGERNWQEEKSCHHQFVAEQKALMGDTLLLLLTPNGGLGVDCLYSMVGWNHFSTLIYDDPDLISAFIAMQAQSDYEWVKNVIDSAESQPIALIYCDIASTTGLMLSPQWIRKNMYANIERLASLYRELGIRVIYHSEGNITRIIDDLISLGIEGINPLEKTVTGMSVPEIRKRWPGLVLWGGVDNKELLTRGTVDEVRKEVEFLVKNYGRNGGLL